MCKLLDERSERVFKNKRGYTQYFTIGDGGNREGLADKWINPKPMWSAFRKAAYGYSQMIVHNETHLHHAWFSNEKTFYEAEELSPVDAHMPADHLWIERPFPRPRQCVTK